MKKLFSIILVLIILASFISCSNNENKDNDDSYQDVTLERNDKEMFTDRDLSSFEKTESTKEESYTITVGELSGTFEAQ